MPEVSIQLGDQDALGLRSLPAAGSLREVAELGERLAAVVAGVRQHVAEQCGPFARSRAGSTATGVPGCLRPMPDCDCPAELVDVDEFRTRTRDQVDEDVDDDVAR